MPKRERIQVILDCGMLDELWFDQEEAPQMTDDEIIEILHEDLGSLIEHATYKIIRHPLEVDNA